MTIAKEHFRKWEKEDVTVQFFSVLREMKEACKEQLTLEDNVMARDSDKRLSRLFGNLEILDFLINLKYEDMIDAEEESSADGV